MKENKDKFGMFKKDQTNLFLSISEKGLEIAGQKIGKWEDELVKNVAIIES